MNFNQFKFHPSINKNIQAVGFKTPTPIQKQSIPPIIAGDDVLGLAQTGTGKTAAFTLPILQKLLGEVHRGKSKGYRKKAKAVIIAPTRELAQQIHDTVVSLSKGTQIRSVVVYGGVGKNPQLSAIRSGVDIIVACPGRLLDLLSESGVSLGAVETLVLDEVDHMFDKGFLPDIRRIMRALPPKKQSLVFSATMPKAVRYLVEEILNNPTNVQIDHVLPAKSISHALFNVKKNEKSSLLQFLLKGQEMTRVVVFTRTKHKAKSLALQLQRAGLNATSIQGNLSQQQRRRAMDGFRDGTYTILVATDIAARGIDVTGVSHVINYDVPDTVATYTHRTGRTGRANLQGKAITLADNDDKQIISHIEKKLGKKMVVEQVDSAELVLGKKESRGTFARKNRTTTKKKTAYNGRRKSARTRVAPLNLQ